MAGAGDDNFQGAEGTDFVFGGFGDDIVRGGEGDDVVVGNEGSDLAISGAGSDIYEFFDDQFVAGDVDIIQDYEAGQDALVFVGSTNISYHAATGEVFRGDEVVASLEAGLELSTLTRVNSTVLFDNGGGILDLADFGNTGTTSTVETETDSTEASSSPVLEEGSTVPLFISDFAGARFFDEPQEGGGIYAAGQEDTTNILIFRDTNDVAVGGDEVDILMAGAGDDNFQGAEGTDFVFGGFGDDIVRGGEGDDVVVGNEGSDILISGAGSDVYEFFADQFVEGDFDVLLDFELGQDSIVVVGSTDVGYEVSSGILTVDGMEVASLEAGLDSTIFTRGNSTVIA